MYQVKMAAEKYLLKQVEKKSESDSKFDFGGGRQDENGAVYTVVYAPDDGKYKADELVLLNPGAYSALFLNKEKLTKVNESDIIARVEEK